MSGRESVYSPSLDMDQHEEGPEAKQRVELRRMMLYHGFQTLLDNNTPLLCSREETTSFKAIVKADGEEKTLDITCDRLLIGPSCWGPDSVPLDISVFLPNNREFFSLSPFGKGYVMSGLSVAKPQPLRAMNLGDILRLETILSQIESPETQISHFHTGNPRRY